MGKWELRQRINSCENKIEENRDEIIKLENKIERFNKEISKLSSLQMRVELYYGTKRAACEVLQSVVKGRAAKSAIDKSVDTYSITNCNIHLNNLESMKSDINVNINKFVEMIGELKTEISNLHSTISWCRSEIASIERREREEKEKNARLNYM